MVDNIINQTIQKAWFNFPFEQHINSLRKLYLTLVYETDPQALPLK